MEMAKPCGACHAYVWPSEGCPHWFPNGRRPGVGRPKGSRNKVTRGHPANCLCAKCAARRAPTVADLRAAALGPTLAGGAS